MEVDSQRAELAAERQHLQRSRRALDGMRNEAERTEIAGGDPVDDKVTIAFLKLAKQRRVAGFTELDASTPLFFARVDYGPDAATVPGQRFYLGRRHVREAAGDDPLVVDWRTDIARPFYRAHPAEPMGLTMRRRFGYDGAELTGFEDESLRGPRPAGPDGLLNREIERPRTGPMRDIVATIQPEQDEIVRADLAVSVCVQGAPGTGKTAVGLHRAAFLLFAHRERLRRAGVLVVGPNRAFLGYISAVLPSLGEFAVAHHTLDDLVTAVPVRGGDSDEVAALKGDARMAAVLARALYDGIRVPTEPVTVVSGALRWTVGAGELADLVAETAAAVRAGKLRYEAGRDRVGARIAAAVHRRAEAGGRSFTDGALRTLARSRPIRAAVDAAWPKIDPATLVHRLLTEPEFLATAAAGVLTADERNLLLRTGPRRSVRTAPWTLADAYLVDEALDLVERGPGFGHVIVDEAQDLSAMQCRALGRRCADGSLTVLGDLAQGTTRWAARSWTTTLRHLGKPGAHLEVLGRGYRVPAEIIDFAGRLLPRIAPGLAPASSARAARGALERLRIPADRLVDEVSDRARRELTRAGSLAVIAADRDVPVLAAALAAAAPAIVELRDGSAPGRAALVPASLAKGLEFDHVIVVEPAAIVAGEATTLVGLRRLYVVLTRAVSALTLIHAEDLPGELG